MTLCTEGAMLCCVCGSCRLLTLTDDLHVQCLPADAAVSCEDTLHCGGLLGVRLEGYLSTITVTCLQGVAQEHLTDCVACKSGALSMDIVLYLGNSSRQSS